MVYITEGLEHYILFKKAKKSLGSLNNILNKGSLFSNEKTRELKSSMGSSGVSFVITMTPQIVRVKILCRKFFVCLFFVIHNYLVGYIFITSYADHKVSKVSKLHPVLRPWSFFEEEWVW